MRYVERLWKFLTGTRPKMVPHVEASAAPTQQAALPQENPIVFVVSSHLLVQSFAICTATPAEGLHFVRGYKRGNEVIATDIVQLPYSHRSVAGAGAEQVAMNRMCIQAYETGHQIVMYLHSHPSAGIDANHRSNTDKRTQLTFERTGMATIGGIWSRDGYLRWWTEHLPYDVQIIGNHLEKVSTHVWKLRDAIKPQTLQAEAAVDVQET